MRSSIIGSPVAAGNCHVTEHLDAGRPGGRRGWSAEAKARLVEESLVLGANVSAIARREGLAPSQLFGWRRKALASGRGGLVSQGRTAGAMRFARVEAPLSGTVEIIVGDIVLRAGGDVAAEHLAEMIRGVRLA